jgi:hypothetical protein
MRMTGTASRGRKGNMTQQATKTDTTEETHTGESEQRKAAAVRRLREQRKQLHEEAREFGEECGRDFVLDDDGNYAQVKKVVALEEFVGNHFVDDPERRLWDALGDDAAECLQEQVRDRELPEAPFAQGFVAGVVAAWSTVESEVER